MKAMTEPGGPAGPAVVPITAARTPEPPEPAQRDLPEGADPAVDAAGRDEQMRRTWDRLRTLVYNDNRRGEVSAAVGLSFVKVKALRRLLVRPMSMRELARELATDKPYVTQIVDALAERGLVVRIVDEHDRRCRIATLTDAGRAAALESEEILTRPPAGMSRLSARDLAELTRILDTLTGADSQ